MIQKDNHGLDNRVAVYAKVHQAVQSPNICLYVVLAPCDMLCLCGKEPVTGMSSTSLKAREGRTGNSVAADRGVDVDEDARVGRLVK